MVAPKRKRHENYQLPPESSHELPHGEEEISDAGQLASLGIELDEDAMKASVEGEAGELLPWPPTGQGLDKGKTSPSRPQDDTFDFFAKLSSYPEICMELATNLRIRQFISLYSISKDFHEIVNGHLMHTMKRCAEKQAPESAKIFIFPLYGPLCIPDPVGRTIPDRPDEIRQVPSLKWLQMIYHRERVIRDILALLAREGHRCPKGMSLSLKKMWLTMDISTSRRRAQFVHNETFWTDVDLYNVQFFCIKLDMRLNDPIDGPGDDGLRRLLLGQRGLSPLWRTLRREALKNGLELVKMAMRYCNPFGGQPPNERMPVFGIPVGEIGKGHLEGWGKGRIHLYRPDELVIRESTRRNLKFTDHLMHMMLWGYVDPATHKNIVVSEEEMYMSDDDEEEGGTPWSDREKTGWKQPEPMEKMPREVVEEDNQEGEDDQWMTDAEESEDEGEDEHEGDEGEGDEMEVDEEDEEDDESEEDEDMGGSGSDDGIDDEFLQSMEVDDDGRLLNPA